MLGKKKKNSKEKNKVGKKRMRTGGYRNLYHLYIHVCMLDFVNEKIVKENKIETGISQCTKQFASVIVVGRASS